MKVLFVLASKNPTTGPYIATSNSILGLLKNGIEVYVIGPQKSPEHTQFFNEIEKNNGKFFNISSNNSGKKYWQSLAKKTLEISKENDINIINTPLKLVHFVGKDLKKQGKKIVVTLHGDPIAEVKNSDFFTKIRTKFLWKECRKYADLICPVSEWLTNKMKSDYRIKNLITIHNPIDFKFLGESKNIRDKLGIDSSEFIISSVSRLSVVKGIDVILKGFSKFVKQNEKLKIKLLIIGKGKEKEKLEHLAEKLGISQQVIFLGFVENPQDYVKSSDVFVMGSIYEPFGMPALEASSLGIPVIASKTGGLVEIVLDNETGYLFKPFDYEQLSKFFQKLFDHKILRKRFGDNARKYSLENFSPNVIGKKTIAAYSTILN